MNARQARAGATLEAIAAVDNLWRAAARARLGKSRREEVEDWWLHREREVLRLRAELLSGEYRPGPYHEFEIFEPKRRRIAAAPFRDRVVHHALYARLAPVLERRFIARSFSCQRGKGTTAARECCRQMTNRHPFVLKCDVRKFFPQIDHAILTDKLRPYLRCPGTRALVDLILAGHHTGPEITAHLFPGDDLALVAGRARGLPIGNLTSQLWANFYLDDLDHWVTEAQRHGAYLRYTDDFLLFAADKPRLWELHRGIVAELARVRLRLAEPKSRLLATREGVPFCGFRFLPARRPRVLGATKRRFEARRYRLARSPETVPALSRCVYAWYQFSREGNSQGLRRAYMGWPLAARLKRRRRRKPRGLRGGSWNNDDPDNFRAANRNHNHPANRNDNNGFRCAGAVGVVGEVVSSPKAGTDGARGGGTPLPPRSQADTSLTVVPAPAGKTGKDAARVVAGNPGSLRGESHAPQPPSPPPPGAGAGD